MSKVSETRIGVRLPEDVRENIARLARRQGVPLSTVVRRAIVNGLRFEARPRD